jgi:hypothetical protein
MTATTVSPASRAPAAPSPVSAYPVKSDNVPPFDGAGMTTVQIMNILHSLDSGAVAGAGAAYTNLGHELGTMAAKLTQHAQTLAQNWTGSAARAAMTSFQQLHDQTSALASQAAQTGSALTWLGTQVLPKFQQLGGLDAGLSGSGAAAAQAQAQRCISALSNYLVTANGYLPDQIGGVASSTAAARNSAAKNSAASSSGGSSTAGPGASGLSAGVAGGLGAAGVANSRQAAGGDSAASGPGDSGAVPGSSGTGSAPGTGGAGSAAGTGAADGTGLSGSGAGGNVAGPGGTASPASPAPAVSRLQSATPVPDSTPGAAAAPVSAAPSAPSAAAGAGDLGAATFSPVPVLPGLSGAGGGGGGGRSNRAAASDAGGPAAGIQPGVPGTPAPGVSAPGVPGLDGGLTGGATPLPEAPALNQSGTGAVPAVEGAGPSVLTVVTADGPVAPGSGDSPGHDGLGAMPMAGGAPGLSEKERARRVWAPEDENIWGLPADCVPPVIGPGRPAP